MTAQIRSRPLTATPASASVTPLRVMRLALLPFGLLLWAIGVSRTNTSHLGNYGLLTVLPIIFYAGIVVLLVSAGIEFSRPRLSEPRLALHAVSLVVVLFGTAPLVYQQGRYSWLYKTMGVVQYVSAHGSVDRSIDIYQSWPGFFALAAWFDKVSGVQSPLDYAKWAQLVFELAAIPLLYTIYRSISLPVWHRWLAIMLYAASNWIAQDYLSPQALALLLSLGIMALVTRWVFTIRSMTQQRGTATWWRESAPYLTVIVFLFAVLTVTHQLSPFMVAVQIVAFIIILPPGPRWTSLVVAVSIPLIALAYLLPNFRYLNSHYGLTYSLGHFLSNIKPPSASGGTGGTPPQSHRIIGDAADLLTAGIWLLAVVGAWRQRKARRTTLALVSMTFAPILILILVSYGNEGLMRAYLFSLPWAVALAAVGLAPIQGGDTGTRHGPIRVLVPLTLAVALFFPAFFGDDAAYVMPTSEVQAIIAFMQSAKPGPIIAGIDNWPSSDTANYNDFPVGSIFDSPGVVSSAVLNSSVNSGLAAMLARSLAYSYPGQPVYVVVAPSMTAYNNDFGVTAPKNLTLLESALAASPYWQLVVSDDGTKIYTLTAAIRHIPMGADPYINVSIP